jgi:hypothetical protein
MLFVGRVVIAVAGSRDPRRAGPRAAQQPKAAQPSNRVSGTARPLPSGRLTPRAAEATTD